MWLTIQMGLRKFESTFSFTRVRLRRLAQELLLAAAQEKQHRAPFFAPIEPDP